MTSLAVIRADSTSKMKTALWDLIRYGRMSFADKPRKLDPAFADEILVDVMGSPLRRKCDAAAIVSLGDSASVAIGRLRKIHPPAHVIIVSPKHGVYQDLAERISMLPEIDLTRNRINELEPD